MADYPGGQPASAGLTASSLKIHKSWHNPAHRIWSPELVLIGEGNEIQDRSPRARNLTIAGSQSLVSGGTPHTKDISVPAEAISILVEPISGLNFSDRHGMTIAFWFEAGKPTGSYTLAQRKNPSFTAGWDLYIKSDGTIAIWNGSAENVLTGDIADSDRHHIVLVYNRVDPAYGVGVFVPYVDGVAETPVSVALPAAAADHVFRALGGDTSAGSPYLIGEYSVFGYELTPEWVGAAYAGGTGISVLDADLE